MYLKQEDATAMCIIISVGYVNIYLKLLRRVNLSDLMIEIYQKKVKMIISFIIRLLRQK